MTFDIKREAEELLRNISFCSHAENKILVIEQSLQRAREAGRAEMRRAAALRCEELAKKAELPRYKTVGMSYAQMIRQLPAVTGEKG